MGTYKNTPAEGRGHLDRLVNLERLLDATLSGFASTSALAADNPDVTVDTLGRTRQVQAGRLIGEKRRSNATRCQVMFTY